MSNRIDLLNEFVGRHEGTRVEFDEQGDPVLLLDGRWVVCLIDDASSGTIRAFADIARVTRSDTATASDQEWVSKTRTVDAFEWLIGCHVNHARWSDKLTAEIAKVMATPAFKQKALELGATAEYMNPQQLTDYGGD